MTRLTPAEVDTALLELPSWKLEGGKLVRRYTFKDFVAAMLFVNKVAALAETVDHHPDISIRYNQVDLSLISHDAGGLTRRDVSLARRINQDLGA